MLLSELLKGINILSEYEDREISDVTDKTHKISEGCAFVCVVGARFDGHSFAENAVSFGAVLFVRTGALSFVDGISRIPARGSESESVVAPFVGEHHEIADCGGLVVFDSPFVDQCNFPSFASENKK